MSITVLVADDKEMVRKAIVGLLQADPDILIVGQAASFEQTLTLSSELHPHVVVLDVHMEDEHSVTPARLKSGLVGLRLLAMSIWVDDETKSFAKAIGAECLLDKCNLGIELIPPIRNCATKQNRHQSLNGQVSAAPD